MNKDVFFYYDESSHSRKLTSNCFLDKNFKFEFVSAIIGIPKDELSSFEDSFNKFEEKWKQFYSCKEIKSEVVIKKKKFKYGLNSFSKDTLDFFIEFFSLLLKYDVYLYLGVFNKIEYLMLQMLDSDNLYILSNLKSIVYSMTKFLCVYRPYKVLSTIPDNINEFLPLFKKFLEKRRVLNTRIHKESEETAILHLMYALDNLNKKVNLEWDYVLSFDGFKKYLSELKLNNLLLTIDEEGIGKTIESAKKDGISKVKEGKSDNYIGIRCSDFVAGFLSNFIDSVENAISYEEDSPVRNESLLGVGWFNKIDEKKFYLYKLAYRIFFSMNHSWFKYYSSCYSDGLIHFLALLKHFEEYRTYRDFLNDGVEAHQNKVNSIFIFDLLKHFEDLNPQQSFEFSDYNDKSFFYNKKGGKIFKDFEKFASLELPDEGEEIKYLVLSIGLINKTKEHLRQSIITISEKGNPKTYLLPSSLNELLEDALRKANSGIKLFPIFVKIMCKDEKISFVYSKD